MFVIHEIFKIAPFFCIYRTFQNDSTKMEKKQFGALFKQDKLYFKDRRRMLRLKLSQQHDKQKTRVIFFKSDQNDKKYAICTLNEMKTY